MLKTILNKIFKNTRSKKSFLETHKYRIKLYTTHYFLEVKGKEYMCWTNINTVLADKKFPESITKFESCYLSKSESIKEMTRFCEVIVAFERGKIKPEIDLEGKLDEFYIIENL